MVAKISLIFVIFGLAFFGAHCADNGLAKTPIMGWNTWNYFACDINEDIILEAAKQLVDSGRF